MHLMHHNMHNTSDTGFFFSTPVTTVAGSLKTGNKKPAEAGWCWPEDSLSGHSHRDKRQQKHHQRPYHGQYDRHHRDDCVNRIAWLVVGGVVLAGHGVLRNAP
jgi:hypothetical protein